MKYENYDFAGWVTKNDIQCSDGVTIRHGAFAHQDGVKVPLVWEHRHDSPENILGHIILEHRDEGVYGYAKCNSTDNGQRAKIQVKEGDITSFSIYANKVQKKMSDVVHGMIREVSLVMHGANPGAMIIEHSDMKQSLKSRTEDDSAIIYHDDSNGSLIVEISHGEDSEGRSALADPARAADAQGSVNADTIGNDSADTLGRQSSNSLQFCTECGTARRGNFCGSCGADMRIDSNQQSQNEDGAQNGRALRNVQHSGFNPDDSLVNTDYDDTVLAHEGTTDNDSGAGESGAQGDDPKSDSPEDDNAVEHSDRTIDDVLASLNDEQQAAVAFLLQQVETNGVLAQSDVDSQYEILHTFNDEQREATNLVLDLMVESIEKSGTVEHTEDPKSNQNEGDETLKHNVFNSQSQPKQEEGVLTHSERQEIFNNIKSGRSGTMKDVLKHASITNIEVLFPEARNITTEPQVFKDRNRNANRIVDATNRVPWGRVKTTIADFTEEEARARGYMTGNQKFPSVFKAVFRSTHPTTVYRKQHIDRDHVIDIEDFDIIRFMNAQMRVLLVEELARAILVGDGRPAHHEDKIDEENIRPILTDDDVWTVKIGGPNVKLDDLDEMILLGMIHYQGSGEPDMFCHPAMAARIRTLRDNENRYMFPNLADYAARIGVREIIPTTFMPVGKFVIGNLSDYTIGSARGGEITTFEDFDIDFNLHKYLIETRLSGATTTPKAFIAGEYEDAFNPQELPSLPVGPNLGKPTA